MRGSSEGWGKRGPLLFTMSPFQPHLPSLGGGAHTLPLPSRLLRWLARPVGNRSRRMLTGCSSAGELHNEELDSCLPLLLSD